jgi:hypothetical protein
MATEPPRPSLSPSCVSEEPAKIPAGPSAKLARARAHEAALLTTLNTFQQTRFAEPERVPRNDNTLEYRLHIIQPVPAEVSAIFGDLVHNLRAALDHVACELVTANGGKITRDTAFPIVDDPKKLRVAVATKLSGASKAASAAVEALRPCKEHNRLDLLWVIHALDVADKHRGILTAVAATRAFTLLLRTRDLVNNYDPAIMPEWSPSTLVPASYEQCMSDGTVLIAFEKLGHLEHQFAIHVEVAVNEPDVIPCTSVQTLSHALLTHTEQNILSLARYLR